VQADQEELEKHRRESQMTQSLKRDPHVGGVGSAIQPPPPGLPRREIVADMVVVKPAKLY